MLPNVTKQVCVCFISSLLASQNIVISLSHELVCDRTPKIFISGMSHSGYWGLAVGATLDHIISKFVLLQDRSLQNFTVRNFFTFANWKQ